MMKKKLYKLYRILSRTTLTAKIILTLRGISASPGLVQGEAFLIKKEEPLVIEKKSITAPKEEIIRFQTSLEAVKIQISKVKGEMAKQLSGVTYVNEVLTMHMGPEFILVNISVNFQDGVTSEVVEECVAQLDVRIKTEHPFVKRVFVEAEARRVNKAKNVESKKPTET